MKIGIKRVIISGIIFLLAISFGCTKADQEEYAMITFMIGEVSKKLDKAAKAMEVDIGDIVKENNIIFTKEDSFCDIKIGGSIIRIKEKSEVTISSLMRKGNEESTTLGLSIGKMLCKPKKLLKSEAFLVKTPTAVAGVRGTKFSVAADMNKTTRIKVFDGKVKIAKRLPSLENNVDKVLEMAPVLEKEQKVVITEKETEKAEKLVKKMIEKDKNVDIARVIKNAKKEIVVPTKAIEKFAVADFAKENKELIEIKAKPKAEIKKIARIIQQEKEMPKPEGRLLVTRFKIYFIKEGKIIWEGKVVKESIKKEGKLYIASGKYVFCASPDGPVYWKADLVNDGKFEIKENKLVVVSGGKENRFDLETGKGL
ncbi:MAG: FecR domain-containing protein [bacterium]|nr:FecR domain-containing protein [bacterium]